VLATHGRAVSCTADLLPSCPTSPWVLSLGAHAHFRANDPSSVDIRWLLFDSAPSESGTTSGRHLVAQLPDRRARHRSDPVGRGGPLTGSDHRLKPGGGEATKYHLSPTSRGKGMAPVKKSTSSPYASDAPSPETICVRGSGCGTKESGSLTSLARSHAGPARGTTSDGLGSALIQDGRLG
jgi:hypothetical protein